MKQGNAPEWVLEQLAESNGKGSYKVRELLGKMTRADGSPTFFDYRRWKWLAFSPYMFSNKCCDVMKKSPAHSYMRKTGRKPIMGMMATESKLRTQNWLRNGCNGFEMKSPVSNPMMFWTEQDALLYIRENKIPIASVYGDVITEDEESGQINLEDLGIAKCRQVLKTTGCNRTGCVFCGFGCHLEKESRFVRLKETHPNLYKYIFKPWDDGGLGYKEVIDWLNEHGDLGIKY